MTKVGKIIGVGLCALWVLFALCIFVGSKIPGSKIFLVQTEGAHWNYGDLYKMSEITAFKQKIPTVDPQTQTTTLQSADVIMLGDSFITSNFESPPLPELISHKTGLSVYYATGTVADPIGYLQEQHYTKGAPKILVYETVERESVSRALAFGEEATDSPAVAPVEKKPFFGNDFTLFENTRVDYFFKNNILISPIRVLLKNIKYALYGKIDERIGAVSTNPPQLFYADGVELAHQREIPFADVVKNIVALNAYLKDVYNVTLVFAVIPNKYAIYYSTTPGGSYNGYLEALDATLPEQGVIAPDIFGTFTEIKNTPGAPLLYYPSDSHYSKFGKQVVADLLAPIILEVKKQISKKTK